MKPIIVDMEEMSDSTEVYGSRPSPILSVIVYCLLFLLLAAVIWAGVFQIDVVVRANGTIRSNHATATVASISTGRIKEYQMEEGMFVKKGEELFSIDVSEAKTQRKSCKAELQKIEERIQILQAYLKELEGEENALNVCSQSLYYGEYENRLKVLQLSCDSMQQDASAQKSQIQGNIQNIENSIHSAQIEQENMNNMIRAVKERLNSFSAENLYYYSAVESYLNNYRMTETQYNTQIAKLQETINRSNADENLNENPESTDYQAQIDSLEAEKTQALGKLEMEMISSIQQSVSSKEKGMEDLNANKNLAQLELDHLNNGTEILSTEKMYANEKNAVYTELNTYENQKAEYKSTLNSLDAAIKNGTVMAQCTGYINLSSENEQGDYITAGTILGNIVPDEKSAYRVMVYVDNHNIGKIKKGGKIRYEVPAFPSSEYGNIEGTIKKISKDVKTDQNAGTSYYLVEATICQNENTMGKKEIEFKQGMAVQAKIVTGQKSVLRFLLEKIDIINK